MPVPFFVQFDRSLKRMAMLCAPIQTVGLFLSSLNRLQHAHVQQVLFAP